MSFTPQHTPGALQGVHLSATSVSQVGQEQIPVTESLVALGSLQGVAVLVLVVVLGVVASLQI